LLSVWRKWRPVRLWDACRQGFQGLPDVVFRRAVTQNVVRREIIVRRKKSGVKD